MWQRVLFISDQIRLRAVFNFCASSTLTRLHVCLCVFMSEVWCFNSIKFELTKTIHGTRWVARKLVGLFLLRTVSLCCPSSRWPLTESICVRMRSFSYRNIAWKDKCRKVIWNLRCWSWQHVCHWNWFIITFLLLLLFT